ncbi:MAG TPA: hypothetical protein VMI12_11935 [Puia sp.]|nr:hypothetical protein [Puia sp.]
MKKIISILAIFVCIHQISEAQTIQDTTAQRKLTNRDLGIQYLEKSNQMRTTGFVVLGLGVAAWVGGAVGAYNHYDVFTGEGSGYIVLWGLGIGATVTGIVLLARSHSYLKKANLILRNENISRTYHVPIKSNIASIGIAFSIK